MPPPVDPIAIPLVLDASELRRAYAEMRAELAGTPITVNLAGDAAAPRTARTFSGAVTDVPLSRLAQAVVQPASTPASTSPRSAGGQAPTVPPSLPSDLAQLSAAVRSAADRLNRAVAAIPSSPAGPTAGGTASPGLPSLVNLRAVADASVRAVASVSPTLVPIAADAIAVRRQAVSPLPFTPVYDPVAGTFAPAARRPAPSPPAPVERVAIPPAADFTDPTRRASRLPASRAELPDAASTRRFPPLADPFAATPSRPPALADPTRLQLPTPTALGGAAPLPASPRREVPAELARGDEPTAADARLRELGRLGIRPDGRYAKSSTLLPGNLFPGAQDFSKETSNAGWKLHLGTDRPAAVSDILSAMGVPHKVGQGDNQKGKDLTAYIGDRDVAERAAAAIQRRAGHLLKPPAGGVLDDDRLFTPNVAGRFDIGSRDREFHQYGHAGIPWLNADMDPYNRAPTAEADGRADRILRQRYGTFYTGNQPAQPATPGAAAAPPRARRTPTTNPLDPSYLAGYRTGDAGDKRFLVDQLRRQPTAADRVRMLQSEADDLQDHADVGGDSLGAYPPADRRMYLRNARYLRAQVARETAGDDVGLGLLPVPRLAGGGSGGRRPPGIGASAAGVPDDDDQTPAVQRVGRARRATGLPPSTVSVPGTLRSPPNWVPGGGPQTQAGGAGGGGGLPPGGGPSLYGGPGQEFYGPPTPGTGSGSAASPGTYQVPLQGSAYAAAYQAAFPNAQVPGTGQNIAQRMFPTFTGGGTGPSIFSRAGIRHALSDEGLRSFGRYFTAYGVAETATSALQQQNQYRLSMATATSAGDVTNALTGYQDASPWAQVPIVGQLGSAVREYVTGDRAAIAGTQTRTTLGEQNAGLMGQLRVNRYANAAAQAGAQGDFAGQRKSIELNRLASNAGVTGQSATERTRLSTDIAALKAQQKESVDSVEQISGFGSGSALAQLEAKRAGERVRASASYRANDDKIGTLQTQLGLITTRDAGSVANNDAMARLAQAAANRSEGAQIIRSGFDVRATQAEFGNSREAERLRREGDYRAAYAGTSDQGERDRLTGQYNANELLQPALYGRQTGFLEQGSRISVLGSQAASYSARHLDYQAGLTGINAQRATAASTRDQEVAGLDVRDPEQAKRIAAAQAKYEAALSGLVDETNGLKGDFAAGRRQIGVGANVSALSLVGDQFGAANLSTTERYRELRRTHPGYESDYDLPEQVEQSGNRLGEQQRLFGVRMSTLRMNQSSDQQDLRFQRLDRTSDVLGAQQSGVDQTLEARTDPYLRAHPAELSDRLSAIRRSTLASVRGLTETPGGGVAFQQGSAFLTRGGFNSLATRDFDSAKNLAMNTAGDLSKAASGKDTGMASTAKLEGTVNGIQKQLDVIADLVKKSLSTLN